MELVPITPAQFATVIPLLCEGFPQSGTRFWERGFARLLSVSHDADAPLGYTLEVGGRAAGIILTLEKPSAVRLPGMPRQINLSSWYVRPEARLYAPAMLRRATQSNDIVYSDLTPSPSVARMLPALGFSWLSNRKLIAPTPLLSLRRGKARLVTGEALLRSLGNEERRLVEDHLRLGCIACGLEQEGRTFPAVFVRRLRRAVVPAGQLLYTSSRAVLYDNIGVIGAFLLKKRRFLLEMDLYEGDAPPFPHVVKPTVKRFLKGPSPMDRNDYSYSELVYFGV